MATTVIIAARNEENTIGAIVQTFNEHPETHGRVFVAIDADTTDKTGQVVWKNGGCAYHTDQRGKGQVVAAAIKVISPRISYRIILCDADYTGLTTRHITKLLRPKAGMTIGVPDFPDIDVPAHVTTSWPHVSGFRILPVTLVPADAHGYLLETQINRRAIEFQVTTRHTFMTGLKSPFQWPLTEQRKAEQQRDREWGLQNGTLPRGTEVEKP